MISLRIVAALVLLCAACDASRFGRFFGSARVAQPKPQCGWLSKPALLKELGWKGKAELNYGMDATYRYPSHDIDVALKNDPGAVEFLSYLTQCYSYNNQTYYRGWNQKMYTQDLCQVRPRTVETLKVWNHVDHIDDYCHIVHPQLQRVEMAQCGDNSGHRDSQKCKRDERSYFQGNYYCVPDGYVERTVLAYCPWNPEAQCIPMQARIPTGCSCKQYTCDKGRALAAGGALSGLASITSRFRG